MALAGNDGGAEHSFVFSDTDGRIDDPRRLERLRSTGLLTAHRRPALDAITHLAAELTGAESALVMLVDVDRQIAPSRYGPDGKHGDPYETPISRSMCQYVVMNDAPLIVGDARAHPVLSSHPAVREGSLVAYAGFPIHAPDGEVLGALCVLDVVPRTWTPSHLSGLKDLSTVVDTKVALRLSRREVALDHQRLLHVLDGAAHTLIVIADRDGVIRTVNHAAEAALGIVVDDVGTRTLTDVLGHQRPWRPEGDLDDAQDWIFLRDGRQEIFSVRVSTLYDADGVVDGYIVVGDDVSARRTAEDLLRDTVRKQAEAVDRLEALDAQRSTFVATASHELRTPVTSILGSAELLADGHYGELTLPQRGAVDRLVRNGRRLHHLIEDLLSWDRIGSDHHVLVRTEVDVRRLSERAWTSLREHLEGRDLTATLEVPDDVPDVPGDATQLERVLVNLLTNAIKFTPDGGAVRLSVWAEPDGVVFEVGDTGTGIAEDDHTAVFEPFFRTSDAHTNAIQGSGIGLSVVRRVVEAHGGRVSLTSAVGEGTSVRVTLPLRDRGQVDDPVRVA